MSSPIEYFMGMGSKFTKNDPKLKADWDYWMMVIMFLAFFSIGVGNIIEFFKEYKLYYLGWTLVMCAILWFQYNSLVQIYNYRKLVKSNIQLKVESKEEMLKEFKK